MQIVGPCCLLKLVKLRTLSVEVTGKQSFHNGTELGGQQPNVVAISTVLIASVFVQRDSLTFRCIANDISWFITFIKSWYHCK